MQYFHQDQAWGVDTWCCEHKLLINPDKTKFMLIGTRQLMYSHSVDFSIFFMGRTLIPVNSARDLGVIMDSHLTYDSHISYLVSSCLSKLVQIWYWWVLGKSEKFVFISCQRPHSNKSCAWQKLYTLDRYQSAPPDLEKVCCVKAIQEKQNTWA